MEITKEKYNNIDFVIRQVLLSMNVLMPYCLTKEDLRSIAWLEILQKLDCYREGQGNFVSFIWTLAKRAIITEVKRNNSYRWREAKLTGKVNFVRLDDVDVVCVDDAMVKIEKSYLSEMIKIAKRRLKKVSEKHLKYFEMCYEQGMTSREIAEKVGDDNYKVLKIRDYALQLFKREIRSIEKWMGV